MGDCEKWLRDYLNSKTVNCNTVRIEARSMGFSRKQLVNAKVALGVITTNNYSAETGLTTNWFWSLPHKQRGGQNA